MSYVYVDRESGFACFAGVVTAATGDFAGDVGKMRWTVVQDGGFARTETSVDYLRGGIATSQPSWCAAAGLNFGGNDAWWGGNVQLDPTKSYNDPQTLPTSADRKDHGWMNMVDNTGASFKNQGDRVSYYATGEKNLANPKDDSFAPVGPRNEGPIPRGAGLFLVWLRSGVECRPGPAFHHHPVAFLPEVTGSSALSICLDMDENSGRR